MENIVATLKKDLFNIKTITELKEKINNFPYFLNIKQYATNTVFDDGNIDSNILIVDTKTPGNNEDLSGKSISGEAGILFDNMLKFISLNRKNVYIINTFFWRPVGNRELTEQEIYISTPFIEKYISLTKAKIIIFLGNKGLQFLKTNLTISKARQQIFNYKNDYMENEIQSILFYHPEYILKQPIRKREVLDDLLFLKNLINNNE